MLNHLGFYCIYSLFWQGNQKSQKLKSKMRTNQWDTLYMWRSYLILSILWPVTKYLCVVLGFLFRQQNCCVSKEAHHILLGFQTGSNLGMDWLDFCLFNGGEESKNLQTLSMYLLNGPPARHWSPAEQLLNCSYLTINHRIFGPYSLLCSVGCNCKPVIIRDVGTMGQGEDRREGMPSQILADQLTLSQSGGRQTILIT